ncbi:MAG TPA: hypothetical protein VEI49_06640 [Terriglobales bacterium]|nr:hypothetical protein [Terriglobales bacterium]HXY15865.1 hypothetical protein [Terriglobales bacterium]
MTQKLCNWLVFVCALAIATAFAVPAFAQMSEVKEKPPMYSYVSFWNIPRAQWGDMQKANASDQSILEKALSNGTIVGYGFDQNLVHQPDGATHDDWFSAMSMAGLLNALDQLYKSGVPTAPVLANATKHWDTFYESRYYNWHSGSWKEVYTGGASFKLKAHVPDSAIDTLSRNFIVPMMEKLLSDGSIHEYEIDTESIHSDPPGMFWLFYVAANADTFDKVHAILRENIKANPLSAEAFDSMIDWSAHRDDLVRTNATYK